ncbi:DnaD domain-containing protein [Amphibacillus sp. MSJ-3]|uniref:DnaD domain-containing protein n=1 Tax=Amphibacillus sp. MSJ-3 TaxID=2841505 RepID=UPI001C0F31D1|nr:DnaD domain-containing protein [Amphibacillus sp. MSJ-3]MBU5594210.1 DnaD domain-containing protein [Amphibacillus sp. MSJ-3]
MKELYQTVVSDQMMISKKLLNSYRQLAIDEQELVIILHIHRFIQEGIFFPTPLKIAELMSIDEQKCSQLLRQLIQKDLLTIVELQTENGIVNERYSLEPLWAKLYQDKPIKRTTDNLDENMMNVFILFEQEFGRALSPIEIEMINVWLDEENIEPALIKAALRESVLMSKLNFRYIDRILREWNRKGIHSVEQARQQAKAFHVQKSTPDQSKVKQDPSVYYNWLEDNE